MPSFKKYNYDQDAMIVVNFEEQLQPNTFEYTLHNLIDDHIDLSAFYEKYNNDSGGRSASVMCLSISEGSIMAALGVFLMVYIMSFLAKIFLSLV